MAESFSMTMNRVVSMFRFTCTRPAVGGERIFVVTTADWPITTVSAAMLTASVAEIARRYTRTQKIYKLLTGTR